MMNRQRSIWENKQNSTFLDNIMGQHTYGVLDTKDTSINVEQAFLLWCASNFDVAATAHALGISPVALQRCVDDENWPARVAPIIEKIKSQKPGDFERSVNRSLAFCQGHRFRLICERVIQEITNWSTEELRENLLPENISKLGSTKKISTRFLGDLASAIEKANSICFQALNDSAQERVRRNDSTEVPALDIHAAISRAMSSVGESKTPRSMLLSAQLEVAADVAKQAVIPKPVLDDTFEPDEN